MVSALLALIPLALQIVSWFVAKGAAGAEATAAFLKAVSASSREGAISVTLRLEARAQRERLRKKQNG